MRAWEGQLVCLLVCLLCLLYMLWGWRTKGGECGLRTVRTRRRRGEAYILGIPVLRWQRRRCDGSSGEAGEKACEAVNADNLEEFCRAPQARVCLQAVACMHALRHPVGS